MPERHRTTRFLLPALALLLAGVIGAMIWNSHASHVARDREALMRLEEDVRGMATTLGYFFYERGNDMRIAADNRQVLTYFENKALGMSEEYGLLASRLAIIEHFSSFIKDRSLGGERIYCGMTLIDTGDSVIAEYVNPDAELTDQIIWDTSRFTGQTDNPYFAVDFTHSPPSVILRQPVTLGDTVVGHVMARISLQRVTRPLLKPLDAGSIIHAVMLDRFVVANLLGASPVEGVDRIADPPPDFRLMRRHVALGGDNPQVREHFVVWSPVEGTPLRVLSVIDASAYLGSVQPWMISAITVTMCALTLFALAKVWRGNAAQLVLAARLEEKTAAEEAMREKAAELQLLLDSLPGYAFFKDAKGRYITANANFCTQVGLRREDLPGKTDHELFPEEYAAVFVANDKRIFSGEERSIEVEEQVEDSGVVRDVSSRKVAIRDKEDRTIGLIGLAFDVTEEKRVERELQAAYAEMEDRVARRTSELAETNQRLEREIIERKQAHRNISIVLAAISSALFNVDTHGRVQAWNDAATRMFSGLAECKTGMELSALPLAWERERLFESIEICRREMRPVSINNLRFDRDDGREGYLFISISPVVDEHDILEGVLILGSDITESKLLEVQLSQAQKLQSIGQLAAGIAHEINTPAQYVGDMVAFLEESNVHLLGIVETVARTLDDPQVGLDELRRIFATALDQADHAFLAEEMPLSFERAREGIERISTIVRAMRTFSRVGESEKKAVDLNDAIESTIAVSRNEWKYAAAMETDLDPALPRVICLPGEMNQVLLNLVVNAAHAVSESPSRHGGHGMIRIVSARENDGVRISISDNGCGIPKSIQGRIFDPFFTTKEVGQGTGQGLTLVHDIVVNKHGGSVSFESGEGKGSTFHIRLPLSDTARRT